MLQTLISLFSKKYFFVVPVLYLLVKIYGEYFGFTVLNQEIFYGIWLYGSLFIFALADLILNGRDKGGALYIDRYEVVIYILMYLSLALQFSVGVSLVHWLFILTLFMLWKVMTGNDMYERYRDFIVQYCFITAILLTTAYFRWNVFIPLILLLGFFLYMLGRYGVDKKMGIGQSVLYIAVGLLLFCEVAVLSLVVPISSYSVAVVLLLATYSYIFLKAYFLPNHA